MFTNVMTMGRTTPARWAGGKSWLAPRVTRWARATGLPINDPFLGGGAYVCHALLSGVEVARASDASRFVIDMWAGLRAYPRRVPAAVVRLVASATERRYYEWRREWNAGDAPLARRSALAWALNRTSFRGLLRVNSRGDFNAPYGHLGRPTFNADLAVTIGLLLDRVDVRLADFREAIEPGFATVCDPPYLGTHSSYTSGGWSEGDVADLVRVIEAAGCPAIVTDAWANRGLYPWPVEHATRRGGMRDGAGRSGASLREMVATFDGGEMCRGR